MHWKAVRNVLLGICFILAMNLKSFWFPTSWNDCDEGSTGDCKPGSAACKMSTLYPGFGSVPAPMFLDRNFKRFCCISDYVLPFGIKSQEKIVEDILSATNNYGLGKELDGLKKRCIVIGNGGILTNKSLGQTIDTFDVVVRLNAAPVKGLRERRGLQDHHAHPESCPKDPEQIESQLLFVLLAFKAVDLEWFRHMVFKEKLPDTEHFWKSVAQHIPREPADMRILNPHFIREASFKLIGLPYHWFGWPVWDKEKGNVPTTGAVAITMALHNCDKVAVAGFSFNRSDPDAPLHYYDNLKMSEVTERGDHNIVKERPFLVKLVKAGAIQDLTMGII